MFASHSPVEPKYFYEEVNEHYQRSERDQRISDLMPDALLSVLKKRSFV